MAFDRFNTARRTASTNTGAGTQGQDESWKAQGFLNLNLGSGRKYGFIPLKASKPAEAALLKDLDNHTVVTGEKLLAAHDLFVRTYDVSSMSDDEVKAAVASMTVSQMTVMAISDKMVLEFRTAEESKANVEADLAAIFGDVAPIEEPEAPVAEGGREKALGYIYFLLPTKDGGEMRLGEGVPLKASVSVERGIFAACKLDPKHIDKLAAATVIDYRINAKGSGKTSLFDLG